MKKLAMVVLVAAALAALPPRVTSDPPPVATLEAQGRFGCAACYGAMMAASATGYGYAWAAMVVFRDGLLATACVSACTY